MQLLYLVRVCSTLESVPLPSEGVQYSRERAVTVPSEGVQYYRERAVT